MTNVSPHEHDADIAGALDLHGKVILLTGASIKLESLSRGRYVDVSR